MKNFDLNSLGVKEMMNNQLIETNGGQVENPWWKLATTIIQAFVILDEMLAEAYIDGSEKGVYEGMPSHSFQH